MANLPIRDMPVSGVPSSSSQIAFDDGQMKRGVISDLADAVRPVASQSEAQAGVDNTKTMTPLRVKDSIASEVGVSVASVASVAAVQSDINAHEADTSNPHSVTKAQVGLDQVDNTSDADKPISDDTQAALDLKANTADLGTAALADTSDFATAAQGAAADSALQPAAIGTTVQGYDADLAAIAALTGTNTIPYRSGVDTWSGVTVGSGLSFSAGTLTATGGGGGGSAVLAGYINGLTLSNDAVTPNTTIDIATGAAVSSDGTELMTLASAITKTTGAWAVGSGNGGLDTGSVANSTWYHVFLIKRTDTGVVDALLSTSATSPTMPTNYTKKRRIGAIATDASGNIYPFIQIGNEFYWSTPRGNLASVANPGTAAVLTSVSAPAGIVTKAIITFQVFNSPSTFGIFALISSPLVPDVTPSQSAYNVLSSTQTSNDAYSGVFSGAIWTNTSNQIRYRLSASTATANVTLVTLGWIDQL